MRIISWVFIFVIVLGPVFALNAWANSHVVIVNEPRAPLLEKPSLTANVIAYVPKGRRLQASGEKVNGFIKLLTRSGRAVWIQEKQVRFVVNNIDQDLVTPNDLGSDMERTVFRRSRLSYDLGLSTGSVNDTNYTELHLGINFFIYDWLAWRNAGFYRFDEEDDFYGLDSSLRAIWRGNLGSAAGLTVFAGPGYRFPSRTKSVPFAEGGVILRLARALSLGAGTKVFFNKWVDKESTENDSQYFIILSGSGSF